MDALKQRWQVWSMRLDAMSFRERLLVFLAVAGVTFTLLFIGLIEPELKRQEQAMLGISGLQQEIFTLGGQLIAAEQQNKRGENDEIRRLRARAQALEQSVKQGENGMIAPDRMIPAMKSLLAAQPGLDLVSLRTLAPRPVFEDKSDDDAFAATPQAVSAPPADQLYKHGVVLQVAGSYAELTAYMQKLEDLPWAVQWESLNLDASHHPRIEMTLELATLSRELTWARF